MQPTPYQPHPAYLQHADSYPISPSLAVLQAICDNLRTHLYHLAAALHANAERATEDLNQRIQHDLQSIRKTAIADRDDATSLHDHADLEQTVRHCQVRLDDVETEISGGLLDALRHCQNRLDDLESAVARPPASP